MIIPKVLGESVPQINFLGKKFLMDIPSSPTNSQFPTSSSQLPVPNFPFPTSLHSSQMLSFIKSTNQLINWLTSWSTNWQTNWAFF